MSHPSAPELQISADQRRLERALTDLRALAQVIIEISRSLDLDNVLQSSLAGIQRVVGGDFGCFVLVQPEAGGLELAKTETLPPALVEPLRQITLDQELLANASRAESRLSAVSAIGQRVSQVLNAQGIDSFVLLPLTALGRAVGILLVVTRVGRVLEPKSVDLLMSIGEQVGMAIENARLHAAVREAAEWRRAFMENSLDAFWEVDPEGRVLYVNDATCKLLGYDHDALLTMRTTDFAADDAALRHAATARLIQEGILTSEDAKIRTKSGEIRTVNYATRAVRDAQGNIVRYQSISRDVTERRKLTETLRYRTEELAALNQIANILSHPFELEQSLNRICEQIVSITGMDSAAICLIDESQQFLNLAAHRGISDNLLSQVQRLGLDDPLTRRIAVDGQAFAIDDVAMYGEPGFAGPRADGYRSGICVPLRKQGFPVGAIFVGSKIRAGYDPSDVELLQNIGNQIGVALENDDLWAQMQRRVRELEGLAQLSAACTTSLDPQVLAEIATQWTRKLLPADLCSLRLIDNSAMQIVSGAVNSKIPLRGHIELDETFRTLIDQRTPYAIADMDADAAVPDVHREGFRGIGIRSFLAVPMPVPDSVIGVLAIGNSTSHVWQPREVELLQTIANQTANAIHNAVLFQNMLGEKRKVQAIFDSGLSGLYATDQECRFVMLNRAAERITGWTLSEVQDKTWQEIFGDPSPLIRTALERKESVYEPEGRQLKTRDSRVFPVAEAVAPLFDEKGAVSGAVGAFWDLTREKQEELAREHFLTMVAHQLRSPLTALLSALQLLERRGLSTARRTQLWNVVKSDSVRLKKFADEFLDMEATVKSPQPIQFAPLPIAALARRLVQKFQTEHSGRRFRVKSCRPEPTVYADADQVENILRNLLDNAVSYSPENGAVTVSIRLLDPDMVDIAVQDQGEGIPIGDRERIFQPFYRASQSTGRRSYGHGLGLSIAQSMVQEMGGEIWIDSKKRRGAVFHFTLRRHE